MIRFLRFCHIGEIGHARASASRAPLPIADSDTPMREARWPMPTADRLRLRPRLVSGRPRCAGSAAEFTAHRMRSPSSSVATYKSRQSPRDPWRRLVVDSVTSRAWPQQHARFDGQPAWPWPLRPRRLCRHLHPCHRRSPNCHRPCRREPCYQGPCQRPCRQRP